MKRLAALLVAALLSGACGPGEPDTVETVGAAGDAPAQTAVSTPETLQEPVAETAPSPTSTTAPDTSPTPTAITEEAEPQTPTATSEPEPMETDTCPRGWEFAGDVYEYPLSQSYDEALVENCGRHASDWCQPMDVPTLQRIYRGSPSTVGECYLTEIWIEKFDLGTGPCRFIGSPYSGGTGSVIIEDMRAEFGYSDDSFQNSLVESCPELDDLLTHDYAATAIVLKGVTDAWSRGDRVLTLPVFRILAIAECRPSWRTPADSESHEQCVLE